MVVFKIIPMSVDGRPGKNNLTVEVDLEDINDNNPEFTKPNYIFPVYGNATADTVIGTVCKCSM